MSTPTPDSSVRQGGSKRRRLTLLFTDLVGSKILARAIEAEYFDELLARVRGIWHEVSAKYGGQVVRTQGDGALIIFGLSHSGEDDGRCAADAALDIHEWIGLLVPEGVPDALLPLRVHSGIHAGTVLLADGDIERGRFDLNGDVVNTAAHLSQRASAGQIFASLDALGPYANFFELGAGPTDEPTGTPGPQVRALLRRGSATRRFEATARRGLTPFIGRADILAFLAGFLEDRRHAHQRCAVVQGSAGLGKTRLIEQLPLLAGPTVTLLRGNCENYLGAEVLQPFFQMLRAWFASLADAAPGEAPAAADPPWLAELAPLGASIRGLLSIDGKSSAGRATSSGVVGDLLAFFSALSARQPLVLVIDDWQWADDASRQLLQALLQLPSGPRVVLASRPRDDGGEWVVGAPHMTLRPFNESETEFAVRRLLSQADPFLIARIHDYAGGVPLFVEELCHSASADQLQKAIEGRGATRSWLATLVVSRLGRLPAEQAEVVRAASVVGNAASIGLLASACGRMPSEATLRALADADFLLEDPLGNGIRFKHGITRDAVYDAIGLHERTALHRRIEQALLPGSAQADREDMLEALAYHCRGAGNWEGAAHYAEQAGDKATAAYALDRARAQYQAAMDALDRAPERSREQSLRWCLLANKLGMTCIFDPLSLGDDLSLFERAVALARTLHDPNTLARAQYWLGYMCYGFGRFREGVTHARQALDGARASGDHRLAAQIEATLGQILTATCQYEEAIPLMDMAVSAKQHRSRRGGSIAIGSAYTLACKGGALADRGDFKRAHACFDEAMELLDDSTHPVGNSVRNWVAISFIWQGRWEEAERVIRESARIAENTHALLLLVACRAVGGFARWSARGDPEGLLQLRDSVRWMEGRRGQFYTSLYYGWIVEACIAERDFDGARRHAMQVLLRAREGERLGEAVACRGMVAVAGSRGRFATAQRWLKRAEQSALLRGSAREAALNQVAAAQLLWRRGHREDARGLAAEAARALRALGMGWHAERIEVDAYETPAFKGY